MAAMGREQGASSARLPGRARAADAARRPRGAPCALHAALALGCLAFVWACASKPVPDSAGAERTLQVTATAYNSLAGQTSGDPALAAWGDRLEPGMRAIAVSRDLIELGLTHRTEVRIEGLPGTWLVLDKMHRRWRRKIDVYMGVDVAAARRFGRRQVRIYWTPAVAPGD